jgi:flagellar hook-basal body complex protein FliE
MPEIPPNNKVPPKRRERSGVSRYERLLRRNKTGADSTPQTDAEIAKTFRGAVRSNRERIKNARAKRKEAFLKNQLGKFVHGHLIDLISSKPEEALKLAQELRNYTSSGGKTKKDILLKYFNLDTTKQKGFYNRFFDSLSALIVDLISPDGQILIDNKLNKTNE